MNVFLESKIETEKSLAAASSNLMTFVEGWDKEYNALIANIDLFDPQKTCMWSQEQAQHFVRALYHVRGHFHEFLWHLGNFAPNKASKEMIGKNIFDELGGHGHSHEQLFRIFAEGLGVDIVDEHLNETTYLPFIKDYNKGHIKWMYENDWQTRISGFAAFELLDNVDYVNCVRIPKSLGLTGKELTFFNVHIVVDHFKSILEGALIDVWSAHPEKVKYGFDFICRHQRKMWQNLSDEIFNYTA